MGHAGAREIEPWNCGFQKVVHARARLDVSAYKLHHCDDYCDDYPGLLRARSDNTYLDVLTTTNPALLRFSMLIVFIAPHLGTLSPLIGGCF